LNSTFSSSPLPSSSACPHGSILSLICSSPSSFSAFENYNKKFSDLILEMEERRKLKEHNEVIKLYDSLIKLKESGVQIEYYKTVDDNHNNSLYSLSKTSSSSSLHTLLFSFPSYNILLLRGYFAVFHSYVDISQFEKAYKIGIDVMDMLKSLIYFLSFLFFNKKRNIY
jgi:hypothetical protein